MDLKVTSSPRYFPASDHILVFIVRLSALCAALCRQSEVISQRKAAFQISKSTRSCFTNIHACKSSATNDWNLLLVFFLRASQNVCSTYTVGVCSDQRQTGRDVDVEERWNGEQIKRLGVCCLCQRSLLQISDAPLHRGSSVYRLCCFGMML